MKAVYTPNESRITIDADEAVLILRALDCFRYSDDTCSMSGSSLLDLAALSTGWRCMVQDMKSPDAERRCRENTHAVALSMMEEKPVDPEELEALKWLEN